MNMQNEEGESYNSGVSAESGLIMEDRIGQLPEDVISVVLSYLTLKEAGRTSILSRKWKNMWELTPRFDFGSSEIMYQLYKDYESRLREYIKLTRRFDFDASETIHRLNREWCKEGWRKNFQNKRKRMEYISWVNKFVDNHRGTNLDEFVVVFHLNANHSIHLDNWISFAVKKRVEEIKIDLHPYIAGWGGFSETYSFMKSTPSLPGIECLTSLDLRYVHVSGETIEHLLLACPSLERLSLVDIEYVLNLRVVGPSLKLKYLYLSTFLHGYYIGSIEICAPNLVSFHCDVETRKLRVEGVCCLRDLGTTDSNLCDKFSSSFSQLETLTIRCVDSRLSYMYKRVEMLCAVGPRLTNLKHLTIKHLWYPVISSTSDLTKIINSCPLLHKFTLELSRDVNEEVKSPTDSCSHKYLKVVEITRFIGRPYQDIKIANYFLRFRRLKKLIIDTRSPDYYVGCSLRDEAESKEKAEKLRSRVLDGVEFLVL